MDHWILETIEDIQRWRTVGDVKQTLSAVRGNAGFDGFIYAIAIPQSLNGFSVFTLTDCPASWLLHYAEQNYIRLDPVVRHCWSSPLAYNWNEFDAVSDEKTRRFFGEAGEFGIRRGVSLGFQGCEGEQALISFSVDQTQPLDREQHCRGVMALHTLIPYVHQQAWLLVRGAGAFCENISLSKREQDTLLWSAEGKTAVEIALILNISESTVVFHLKNAARKLNVSNRSQAVAKAVLLNLITPAYAQPQPTPIKFESLKLPPKR